jgi:hypothetical protein
VPSGVSACGFAAAGVFAGHAELGPVALPFSGRCRVRASGLAWVQDRAEPAGVAGAGGVLDAGAREPMIEACGEGPVPRRVLGVCGCRHPRAGRPAGQAAGCIHPFVCPRHGWPGGMGRVRVRAGRGQSQRRPRRRAGRDVPLALAGGRMSGGLAPGGGGQNGRRPRAWPRRAEGHAASCRGLARRRMRPSRMP